LISGFLSSVTPIETSTAVEFDKFHISFVDPQLILFIASAEIFIHTKNNIGALTYLIPIALKKNKEIHGFC